MVSDPLVRLAAKHQPESRVVVVDIDEASLSQLGGWPWSRHQLAELVETLIADHGARHVGMDIVFPDPADAFGDARLLALGQSGKLSFAQVFDFTLRPDALQSGALIGTFSAANNRHRIAALPATGFLANHVGLSSAPCAGNIGIQADADGLVRRLPWYVAWQGQLSPLLPLAMVACDAARPPAQWQSLLPAESLWHIPFRRTWDSFTVIPAHQVLSNSDMRQWLQGAWVLIGSSAMGLNDRVATPLGQTVAGVMVHAAALSHLLDWIEHGRPDDSHTANIVASIFIALALLIAGLGLQHWRAWVLLPLIVGLALLWCVIAAWMLQQGGSVRTSPPLWSLALLLVLAPLEWWRLQREQDLVLQRFAHYVSPVVLKQMLQQGIDQPMQPRYTQIAVLSADMQGYTQLINASSLQEAADLTTGFLSHLTQPLLENHGTLDKYIGDGMMAFWGAPVPVENPVDRAVSAALDMLKHIRQWNEERIAQGLSPARVRLGIEYGHALVGDLGTSFRTTYTAVGDCVNIASKLQSAAKLYEFDILIGPGAAAQITSHKLIPLQKEHLPGIKEKKPIFTIEGAVSSLPK